MRAFILSLTVVGLASAVWAQDEPTEALDQCAQTEVWVMQAVKSRLAGQTKGQIRRQLLDEMGRDTNGRKAAGQLAEFVFSLPTEYLTPEVASLARAQCEAL